MPSKNIFSYDKKKLFLQKSKQFSISKAIFIVFSLSYTSALKKEAKNVQWSENFAFLAREINFFRMTFRIHTRNAYGNITVILRFEEKI